MKASLILVLVLSAVMVHQTEASWFSKIIRKVTKWVKKNCTLQLGSGILVTCSGRRRREAAADVNNLGASLNVNVSGSHVVGPNSSPKLTHGSNNQIVDGGFNCSSVSFPGGIVPRRALDEAFVSIDDDEDDAFNRTEFDEYRETIKIIGHCLYGVSPRP